MLTRNIEFKNFKLNKKKKKILNFFKDLIKENNEIINSLKNTYKDSYSKKIIKKFNKFSEVIVIGMGGSILGSRAIYRFLKFKIKKNFFFLDHFSSLQNSKKKQLRLIVSKSGNTLETITNSNILLKNKKDNIFITENKNSYLMNLAKKLKSEIIHHNNFIGGRYSVLSEVGMLPAELMGLKSKNFRRLNDLIKNKKFVDSLVQNVSDTIYLINKKKFNSVILNYDDSSSDLFFWYQQLIAESLGKKSKGILPVVSSMPKDNHSLMQLYLDGFKNNFFTFFYVHENLTKKINNKDLLNSHFYLKNKSLNDIKFAQFQSTVKVFKTKDIPFRSFFLNKRNEETLGELFTFFILETILLGKALRVNPYDQPSVELIKDETKNFLINF